MSTPHGHRHTAAVGHEPATAAVGGPATEPLPRRAIARHAHHETTLRHSPHPVAAGLPGMYQDDPLVAGICAAADAALAPVFAVLDNYASYLDPATAPADTLDWLASWIGAALPDTAEPGPRRQALQRTAEHLAWHGTAHGIRTALATVHGLDIEIEEPGATAWTLDPDTPLPGQPAHRPVRFRVTGAEVDPRTVDSLLEQLKPAHVRHTIDVAEP